MEMMVMIQYLYRWHHIDVNVTDGNVPNDNDYHDDVDDTDDNENAKLGGKWSTAKERKDLKRERSSQSGKN